MTAQPSRITADGKLRIQLAETYPCVESIGVVLVRLASWDGAKSSVAWHGVALLADDTAIFIVVVVTAQGFWHVDLQPQESHKPETPIAYFQRWTEHLCSGQRVTA